MKLKRYLFSTLLLPLATTVMAQGVLRINLHDALALGFEQNPAIVATKYAEESAHRERQAAIGLFMPQITLRGGYAHLDKDVKIDFNPMLTSLAPIIGEG